MKDRKHAEYLLTIAKRDFDALKAMAVDPENFDDSIFGFHAQQAVEKIIKALLSFHAMEFNKTHDLTGLFTLLKDKDNELTETFFDLRKLTSFAVDYRYDLIYDEVPLDRKNIVVSVESFYESAVKKVRALE